MIKMKIEKADKLAERIGIDRNRYSSTWKERIAERIESAEKKMMTELEKYGSTYWLIRAFNDPTVITPEEASAIANTIVANFIDARYNAKLLTYMHEAPSGRIYYIYQVDVSIYN